MDRRLNPYLFEDTELMDAIHASKTLPMFFCAALAVVTGEFSIAVLFLMMASPYTHIGWGPLHPPIGK